MVEAAQSVTVRLLKAGDELRWDAFVEAASRATFFHLSGWKQVIETAFGHRTFYMMAERGDAVVGVLPLTLVKTKLFGASLISNAFGVCGGPVGVDAASLKALEDAAIRLMEELKVPVLEFRSWDESRSNWPTKGDLYVSFCKPIDPSVEKNLKAVPRKQRAMIRKGIQNDLRSVLDDDVDRLFHLYSESVRNLGTPVFSKKYLKILRNVFSDRSDIITILDKHETPVASVMSFYFRDQVLPYYGGGAESARRLAANDFMYWEVMRRACERGFRVFDFGRSKRGTGAYDFKRYWGFEPTPLVYQFRLAPGRQIPELNPLNPKFRLFIGLWRRLPLAVAERLGPPIARGLA